MIDAIRKMVDAVRKQVAAGNCPGIVDQHIDIGMRLEQPFPLLRKRQIAREDIEGHPSGLPDPVSPMRA